jgi:hypothetical protein
MPSTSAALCRGGATQRDRTLHARCGLLQPAAAWHKLPAPPLRKLWRDRPAAGEIGVS